MRIGWIARRIDAARGDSGVAIVLVVGVGMVVSMLLLSLTAYTILSVSHSRQEQDTQAALSAAQAGVDDYLSRLNANNTYWQVPISPAPNQCVDNVAIRTIGDACGDIKTGWAPISGQQYTPTTGSTTLVSCSVADSAGNFAAPCGAFHYDVDISQTIATGAINLTSTGKAHGKTRSVKVVVRRQSFGDFMYYTDLETSDPGNPFSYDDSVPTPNTDQCYQHVWDTPTRPTSYVVAPAGSTEGATNSGFTCDDITFNGGDVLNGPIHSNDAIRVGTATFNGPVTTAWPRCAPNALGVAPGVSYCYRDAVGTATFNKSIKYVTPLLMPPTPVDLRKQTDPAQVTNPGCMYEGPTRIQFQPGGSMKVWSPYTRTLNSGCGSVSGFQTNPTQPQTITPPANNVIYVDPSPASVGATNGPCPAGFVGGLPVTPTTGGTGSTTGDINAIWGDYDCTQGTLYVDGTFNGRMTVGSSANIIIVGDLKYDTSAAGNDSLGLVAQTSVEIYHPVRCQTWYNVDSASPPHKACLPNNSGGNSSEIARNAGAGGPLPGTPTLSGYFANPIVNAAMLSLQHSFVVQAYNLGTASNLGSGGLSVFGSIAQKFRGAVATSNSSGTIVTGYKKVYTYDNRLKFAPPPYYLDPVASKYISAVFSEIPPAYKPTDP